ncbi:hypothetical protein niasHT_033637 [Heterodera trifolii]|uniref:Uncharacterized protein n=1 Tax=Heterodera trifolii TaxID=157864 RepID=A0ABD2IGX4_9BILA
MIKGRGPRGAEKGEEGGRDKEGRKETAPPLKGGESGLQTATVGIDPTRSPVGREGVSLGSRGDPIPFDHAVFENRPRGKGSPRLCSLLLAIPKEGEGICRDQRRGQQNTILLP